MKYICTLYVNVNVTRQINQLPFSLTLILNKYNHLSEDDSSGRIFIKHAGGTLHWT